MQKKKKIIYLLLTIVLTITCVNMCTQLNQYIYHWVDKEREYFISDFDIYIFDRCVYTQLKEGKKENQDSLSLVQRGVSSMCSCCCLLFMHHTKLQLKYDVVANFLFLFCAVSDRWKVEASELQSSINVKLSLNRD